MRSGRRPALRGTASVALPLALLGICALLRCLNLADNPGWDGDEGYNWSIASHLAAGHVQMFGLRYAFVQHPPLFYLLGALLMHLWTADLLALRTLSVCCGLCATVGLLGLGSELGGKRLGYAAAASYAVWPQAVLQIRWAYTYNLLAALVVLALWMAVRARRFLAIPDQQDAFGPPMKASRARGRNEALLAGMLVGLALATDQEALPLVPAILLIIWRGGPVLALGTLVMSALAPALYLGWMLYTRASDLLFDISHTANRLEAGGPVQHLTTLLTRFEHLLRFEPLLAVGFAGMLLLPRGAARNGLLLLTAGLILVVLEVRDPAPLFRAAEPLLSLAALGLGTVVLRLMMLVHDLVVARAGTMRSPVLARKRALIASGLLVGALALIFTAQDIQQASGRFVTGIQVDLPESTAEAYAMGTWVNARVRKNDLVIVMPATAWLFHCRTADLLQAVAITGHSAGFYPDGLARARFVYDTHLAAARFLIMDTFARLWIVDAPRERSLATQAMARWPLVYHHGEYAIYANPAYYDKSSAG